MFFKVLFDFFLSFPFHFKFNLESGVLMFYVHYTSNKHFNERVALKVLD